MRSTGKPNRYWFKGSDNSRIGELFWFLDKRYFGWDWLPALARVGAIQKSYVLLLLLPAIDRIASPLIRLPDELTIHVKSPWTWMEITPDDASIGIALGLPFSWAMVYYLVLSVAMGALVYELCCPRICRPNYEKVPSRQLIIQEMRMCALGLWSARRMNTFLRVLVEKYSSNPEAVKNATPASAVPPEKMEEETKNGRILIPDGIHGLQDATSQVRLDKLSVYFWAEKIEFDAANMYSEAIEHIRWFANETRLLPRWMSGLAFLAAICLFAWLVGCGLVQMLR